MPGHLAEMAAWVGAGCALAFCVLARLADRVGFGVRRASPTLARCRRAKARTAARGHALAAGAVVLVPLLSCGALAVSFGGGAMDVAYTTIGALGGAWLAIRLASTRHAARLVWMSGATGFALSAGAFVRLVVDGAPPFDERVGLYVAVSLGACLMALAASFERRGPQRPKQPKRSRTSGDLIMRGVALVLWVGLGAMFAVCPAALDMGLASLLGAAALAAALCARSPRVPVPVATRSRALATPLSQPGALRLAGMPDEWLVAACCGDSFIPAYTCVAPATSDPRHAQHGWRRLPRRSRERYDTPLQARRRR